MKVFPTQYSTLSSIAIEKKIESEYGFKKMACKYLLRGVSDIYILNNKSDSYILKVYRSTHRSVSEIKGEIELLNILKRRGAKVAFPIPNICHEYLLEFNAAEGLRYGVLFSYAAGESINHLNGKQLNTLGREMAAIHNITSEIELTYNRNVFDLNTTIVIPLKKIEPAFKNAFSDYQYLKDKASLVIGKLKSMDKGLLSYGYCHYDFNPKNFHFDSNDNITFFDFDFAGKGYLANDIMSFWLYIYFGGNYGKKVRKEKDLEFNLFITAYKEVRSISSEEMKALPYLGFASMIFQLAFCYENFDDFSNTFFSEHFLNERVAIIKNIIEQFCSFDL